MHLHPAGSAPAGYLIRAWREDDDALLLGIENRAAELFRDHGYPDIADHPFANVEEFRAMIGANRVWVAATLADEPAGYAVAGSLGDYMHLRELSVDPAHGRRGLGAALVRAVIAAAQEMQAVGVSLTTFRSPPFNQPFYERLGFHELPLSGAPPQLARAFRDELPPDIDAAERLLMVLAATDSG